MSSLIDRYLYDVSRRLPESMRADVERELRSNIEDMLSEEPGDEEIEKVLTELGSPSKLAVRYHPRPQYLISPELFSEYLMVLKIVAITLASLLAALAVFQFVFGDPGDSGAVKTITAVLSGFFSGAWSGIIHAFFWVTISFFLFEYFGNKKEPKQWTPRELPAIPENAKTVIKRPEAVANGVFSVLFSILFLIGTLRSPQFIAWYEAGKPAAPLFNEEIVRLYLPFFIGLMAFTLLIMILKLLRGRWTVSVALAQILYSIFSAVVSLSFILRPHVISDAFVTRFADKLNVEHLAMSGHIETSITVVAVLIVLGAFGDIISAIVKTVKTDRVKRA